MKHSSRRSAPERKIARRPRKSPGKPLRKTVKKDAPDAAGNPVSPDRTPAPNPQSGSRPPGRDFRLFRFPRLSLGLVLVLILLGAYGGLRWKFGPGLGIYRVTREVSSQTLEVRARQLYRLSTVELVWKTVFPHDFFPPQEAWSRYLINRQYRQPLSPEEEEWNELYDLCLETGFSPRREQTEFLVFTVLVRAGYDLEGTGLEEPAAARDKAAAPDGTYGSDGTAVSSGTSAGFSGGETGPESPSPAPFLEIREERIYLNPPPARILGIVLEDPERETYPFPDTRLSPEALRKISRFVSDRALSRAESRRLLDRAEENGRAFLRNLFRQAGYETVIFRDEAPEEQPGS